MSIEDLFLNTLLFQHHNLTRHINSRTNNTLWNPFAFLNLKVYARDRARRECAQYACAKRQVPSPSSLPARNRNFHFSCRNIARDGVELVDGSHVFQFVPNVSRHEQPGLRDALWFAQLGPPTKSPQHRSTNWTPSEAISEPQAKGALPGPLAHAPKQSSDSQKPAANVAWWLIVKRKWRSEGLSDPFMRRMVHHTSWRSEGCGSTPLCILLHVDGSSSFIQPPGWLGSALNQSGLITGFLLSLANPID